MRSILCALALVCLFLVQPFAAYADSTAVAAKPAVTAEVQPVAGEVVVEPAIQFLNRGNNCPPNGNCHRQPVQPQQPPVAEPPKFDLAETSTEPGVPTGVSIVAGIIAAIVGGGAGVAVQWKATHAVKA